MAHMRISPRHLGPLNMAKFCPRCYWYQIQLGFQPPFPCPMPGLMHNLDRFEKRLVRAHLAEHGEVPHWLRSLGCVDTADYPRKLTWDFPEYDVTMIGLPDEVFLNTDNNLVLVDYKSALHKGNDDPFLPIYEAQLLGYAVMLEKNEIGTVDSAALIYFQNQLKDFADQPLDLITRAGFTVPFNVEIHPVDLDRGELDSLLKRFRKIADRKLPPKGIQKCESCGLLQRLLDAEVIRRDQEVEQRQRDELVRLRSRELEADRQLARSGWTEDDALRHEDEDWVFDCLDGAAIPNDHILATAMVNAGCGR